ncbi:hypothetical protein [Cohnella panacarvi]|uniref:hypothetical protein n=1 Tax=Cohnella panacarvi TaxID=400776 RepID=UPI00047A0DC1|nr:hypothetical protein [Cohnella panacarvi]
MPSLFHGPFLLLDSLLHPGFVRSQGRGEVEYVWSFKRTFFGPAWFLEASIYFTLFYALYRLIAGKVSRQPKLLPFPSGARLRLVYPTGEGPLDLQLGYFPSYIALFVAGIIASKAE